MSKEWTKSQKLKFQEMMKAKREAAFQADLNEQKIPTGQAAPQNQQSTPPPTQQYEVLDPLTNEERLMQLARSVRAQAINEVIDCFLEAVNTVRKRK